MSAPKSGRSAVARLRCQPSNGCRYLVIQHDMLSAHRRIEDGPDLVQTLGRRPQGAKIISVKPTDRELKGHPLPDGAIRTGKMYS